MNISLRQLRVLMVVARHRSFTEAAKAIGLSQSAVSLNIRQVEQQLGLRLFDRTTRRVQLTEIGAAVFSSSARLIDELDTVLREARDIGAQRRGTAVVAAVPSVVNRLIPGCIAACATEHPHVRVVLDDCSAADVIRKLSLGEVEIGIRSGPFASNDFDIQTLSKDAFRLVMRRDHRFAARKRIRWRDLAGERLVMLNNTSGSRDLITAELERSGITVEVVLDLAQPHSVIGMVAAGIGISIMPELAAPAEEDAALAVRPLVEPEIQRTILLVTRRDRFLSPAAGAFRDILVRYCSTSGATRSKASRR